jgi:uncharacterized surface protein with fasciclin (FAS1) repeats
MIRTLTIAAAAAALLAGPALAGDCASKSRASHAGSVTPAVYQSGGHHRTTTPAPAMRRDIVDTAVGAGQFTTLVAAVQAAGLVDTLKGPGPFTVFAPTDAAFAKLPGGTVQNLLKPENRATLTRILTYHVVPGRVLSTDLAGKTAAPVTVQGGLLTVDGRSGVKVNDATVVGADVLTSNGVIHVIDTVLMPK